jgi:hypothetical protein
MIIRGTTEVRCPACGKAHTCELVQSVNPRENPGDKQRLLDGELNILACDCGKRTQLLGKLVFHDPDREYYGQVCPGGEDAMRDGEIAFSVMGAVGTQRLVPSPNALVEQVRLLDAGLLDWAVEMNKVLLLASLGELERVLLFDRVDRDAGVIHWVLFDDTGRTPRPVSSPLAQYDKLAARAASRPAPTEHRIDRAWALEAVRRMIADAN